MQYNDDKELKEIIKKIHKSLKTDEDKIQIILTFLGISINLTDFILKILENDAFNTIEVPLDIHYFMLMTIANQATLSSKNLEFEKFDIHKMFDDKNIPPEELVKEKLKLLIKSIQKEFKLDGESL